VGPFWIETFRYNKWANEILLGACANLSEDQLHLTAAGTYGDLAATFMHLLGAEQRYIRRLTGEDPGIGENSPFPGVAALAESASQNGDRLIALAERVKPADILETTHDGRPYRMNAGVVLIQAIHHGNDHRTHVCTILGSHGLPHPDMDVWSYGEATGAMGYMGAG
jgi:uncharacterized damage-inducible protein DinB